MTNLLRFVRGPILASVAALGLASCNMDVTNPSVIDAGTFDPTADGKTLALSAQTNFYLAFQSVALYGGLISDEIWTGAIRLQTNRLASRTFLGSDDINDRLLRATEPRGRVERECRYRTRQGRRRATAIRIWRAHR